MLRKGASALIVAHEYVTLLGNTQKSQRRSETCGAIDPCSPVIQDSSDCLTQACSFRIVKIIRAVY